MKVALEGKDKVVEIPDGLSPQETEKQLKSFYTPDELYGSTSYAERQSYRLRKGRSTVTGGKAFWSVVQGTGSEEEAYKTWNIATADFTAENDEKYSARSFGEQFVGATAELAPYMLDSSVESMKYGEYFGAAAATTALAFGVAGPQAALPEEVITVPSAYLTGRAIGQTYGAWMNAVQVEGGLVYKELRDNNVSADVAKQWAIPAGYLIGAVEMMQLKQIIPGLGKSAGRKEIVELIRQAATRKGSGLAAKMARFSARLAKNTAKFMAAEIPEEVIQENISIIAEIGAAAGDEKSGWAGPTDAEIIQRNKETLIQSLLAFPLLGLPGSVHTAIQSTSRERAVTRVLTARAKESLSQDLAAQIEEATKFNNYDEFMESLDGKVDDRHARNYGFDNRVLYCEAVWTASREVLDADKTIKKIAREKATDGPPAELQAAIDRAMDLATKLGVVIDSVEYVDEEMVMDPADPLDLQEIIAHGFTEEEINNAIRTGERFIVSGEHKVKGEEGSERRTNIRFFRGATEQDAYHEIVVHALEDQGGLPGWTGTAEEHARFLEGIIAEGKEATIIELTPEGRRINTPVRNITGVVQKAIRLVNDGVSTIDVGVGCEIHPPSSLYTDPLDPKKDVNKEIKVGKVPAKVISTRAKINMEGVSGWTKDKEGDWRNADGYTYIAWYAREMTRRMRHGEVAVVQGEDGNLYYTSPGLPAYKCPQPFKNGNTKVKAYILDMPAVYTCKNCAGYAPTCYAVGAQIQYADTMLGRFSNLYMWMNHRAKFKTMVYEQLRGTRFKLVRLHSSGDIFSQIYLSFLEDMVKDHPDKMFYVYTKVGTYDYASIDRHPNFNRVNSVMPDGQKNYGDMAYIKEASKKYGVKICPASVAKEGVKVVCALDSYKGKGIKCSNCTRDSYMLFLEHGAPQRKGAEIMMSDVRDDNFMGKVQHAIRKTGPVEGDMPTAKGGEKVFYHGTSKENAKSIRKSGINDYSYGKGGDVEEDDVGFHGLGVYVTSKKDAARKYADFVGGGVGKGEIVELRGDIKLKDVSKEKDLSIEASNKLSSIARSEGYDGLFIGEDEIVIWNYSKLSSTAKGGESGKEITSYAIRKAKAVIEDTTGVTKTEDIKKEYQLLKRLFQRMQEATDALAKQAKKEREVNVKWTEAEQKLADDIHYKKRLEAAKAEAKEAKQKLAETEKAGTKNAAVQERWAKAEQKLADEMHYGQLLAQAEARAKKIEAFRDKLRVFAMDNLKGEDRGKFLTAVTQITTEAQLDKAMERVLKVAEESAKKELLRRIKQQVKRITTSKSIAIDYVQKIEELVNEFDLTGHTAKTIARLEATKAFMEREHAAGRLVDMPSDVLSALEILARKPLKDLTIVDLENVHEKIRVLADLGKTKLRTRKAAIALMKERDLLALKKDSKAVTSKKVREDNAISGRLSGADRVSNTLKKTINLAQMKDLVLHPIDALFDFLDGQKDYTGANFRIFKRRIDVAFSMYLDMKFAIQQKIDDLANKLDLDTDSMERIGVYAAKMQEGGMDKLLSFFTEEQVEKVVLTDKEMRFYNSMRDELDALRIPIEKTMREVYNQPLGSVVNYFPFMTDFDAMSDAEVRDRFGDKVITLDQTLKKNVEMGFTITRKGGKNRIKINAAEIFGKHVDDAVYLITVGRETKYLGELAKTEEYAEAVGDVGQEIVREWIDLLARKGVSQGDRVAALDLARKYTGVVALGFKLSSALVQLTSLMDGAALIGTHAFNGFSKIITSTRWRAFVIDNMPEVRSRIGDDIAFQDFGKDAFAKKLGDIAYKPLQTIDRLTATGVAAGAYIKWCKDNDVDVNLDDPDPDGIEYAQKISRRTQSSSQFKDLPLAITKGKLTGNISVDKAILQFQSFMLNRWSLVRHDLWRNGVMGKNKKQAISIMMWLVAANFAEGGIRRWTKEMISGLMGQEPPDDDDEDKKFYKDVGQVLQNIPFLGSIYYAMLYEDFPVPSVSMLSKLIAKAGAAVKADDDKGTKILKALLAAVPGGGQIEPMIKGE